MQPTRMSIHPSSVGVGCGSMGFGFVRGVHRWGDGAEFLGGMAGGAHLGGEHLQNLERQAGVGLHQGFEVVLGDEADPRAVAGR